MRTIFNTILGSFIIISICFSQVSHEGTPYSIQNNLDDSSVPTFTLPTLNIDSLITADESNNVDELPPRFAFPYQTELNLSNSGLLETFEDGNQLWRLRIHSPGAYSLGLIFSHYYLTDGSELYLYNEDKTKIRGAYTSDNNKIAGVFSTFPFPGETAILELFLPEGVGEQQLEISVISHDFVDMFDRDRECDPGFLGFGFECSAECQVNVNCDNDYFDSTEWDNEKRSVCLILLDDGTRTQSAALINNIGNHNYQYLLTSFHGLQHHQNELNTCLVLFNYESEDCFTPEEDPGFLQTVSGLNIISAGSQFPGYTDFTLLEIIETIPAEYNVYYSGWNADYDCLETGPFVGIHHPKGDIKKINYYNSGNQHLNSSNESDPNYCCTGQYWTDSSLFVIPEWEIGTTENGTSGSPVFNSNHQIIGQCRDNYDSIVNGNLHPYEVCENNKGTIYGWFGMSIDWVNENFPELPTLRELLDPNDTGLNSCGGRNWDSNPGCTDPMASNYDPDATIDDGSCFYVKSFHAGWNWVGFPRLVDNEDGVPGNNPDPVEDIFNNLEDEIDEIWIEDQDGLFARWEGENWNLEGGLIGVESRKGYKVEMPEDQEQYIIPTLGNRVPENTLLDLYVGENLVPYFLTEPQHPSDAFPQEVLDHMTSIMAEDWFMIRRNGEFYVKVDCPPQTQGSEGECFMLEYGSMVIVNMDMEIPFNWNIPGDVLIQDALNPLVSDSFPFEKKKEYIPVVVESIENIEKIENVQEIGAIKEGEYVGAEVVYGYPINLRVYDNSLADITFEVTINDGGLGRQSDNDTETPIANRLLGIKNITYENGVALLNLSDIDNIPVENPKVFSLLTAFPNPLNPGIEINFKLNKDANVELGIYDILGRKVKTLMHGNLTSSSYSYTWAGTAEDGSTVSSGVYFYRLQSDGEVIQNKIMLLK